MLSNRKLHSARHRTIIQVNRVKSQSGDTGSLPADTDGSTPTTGKPGGEYVVKIRSPSSQYPYPSLETVGNDRAHEGVTADQNTPRSRLPTPPTRVGGVWSMARPVSVASKRRGRTHPFGRSPLLWLGDRACVEPQAGESASRRTGVVTRPPPRRGAREPGTPFGC
jgi:hypothetical protein